MDVRLTWTGCDEAGDYVVPNVLSLRDLVSRPDNMDENILHTEKVQNRSARFVTRNYVYETGSMTGILGQLKWESLKEKGK